MTPAEKRAKTMRENWAYQRELGQRIRRLRLEAGLTTKSAARAAGVLEYHWKSWEVGSRRCAAYTIPLIAAALGIPIGALLTDRRVIVEVQASSETLKRIRREGRPAALEVAGRLTANIAELLLAEASRPKRDFGPHARAKPRRSREEILAAKLASFDAIAERQRAA